MMRSVIQLDSIDRCYEKPAKAGFFMSEAFMRVTS